MNPEVDNPIETDDDKWKAVRLLLKNALLSGKIPFESKEMLPKQVLEKFANHQDMAFISYKDASIRDKYTRILRGLRKKHKEGDLVNEDLPNKVIRWSKSAAKQFLKKCFRQKIIPADYSDSKEVWETHCKGEKAFARMQYDKTFQRRLESVRDDYLRKKKRCEDDLKAFQIAKKNHPTPEFNCRGEPQWHGSPAQKLLKELVARGGHIGKKPADLWELNKEFKVYSKQTFRDHLYQEERLLKFNNYVEALKQKKFDELQY